MLPRRAGCFRPAARFVLTRDALYSAAGCEFPAALLPDVSRETFLRRFRPDGIFADLP